MALLRPFCIPGLITSIRAEPARRQSWIINTHLPTLHCSVEASWPAKQRMSTVKNQQVIWRKILDTYQKAQESGSASKFKTNTQILTDQHLHIKFVLRVSDSLRDKPKPPKSSQEQKAWKDPFAPYDEALWVDHLSPTHTLLLNKFNVVAYHVLVVTKDFKHQTDGLDLQDLEATWQVVQAIPQGALAYFNCGPESGASQPHKHIQVVPLPLADDPAVIPSPLSQMMDRAWRDSQLCEGAVASVHDLPYQNYFSKLSSRTQPNQLISMYKSLLQKCSPGGQPPESYNLLLTRDHMVVVPRRKENIGSVAINALGFAGTILVNSKAGLEYIQEQGPVKILEAAGCPWQKSA